MSKRDWFFAGGALGVFILMMIIYQAVQDSEPDSQTGGPDVSKSTPRPTRESTKSVTDQPPAPHTEGKPHGLGVTNRMIVDALLPMGFTFEEDFSESIQRPMIRGSSSLGTVTSNLVKRYSAWGYRVRFGDVLVR